MGILFRKYGLLFLIAVLTAAGMLIESIPNDEQSRKEEISQKFKNYIEKYDEAQIELLSEIEAKRGIFPLQFFVFKGDSAVSWTTDKSSFEPFEINENRVLSYKTYNDGFYRVYAQKDKNGFSHYSLLKLSHHFPVAVHGMPQNKASIRTGIKDEIFLSNQSPDSSYFPIQLENEGTVFYVKILTPYSNSGLSLWFYIIALILLSLVLTRIFAFNKSLSKKDYRIYTGFIVLLLIALRVFLTKGIFLHFWSSSPMFSPELFAHSYLTNSYVKSLLNLLIISFAFLFINKTFVLPERFDKTTSIVFVNILILGFVFWSLSDLQHLIFDSKINFDPIIIEELNVYTILGILLIGLYLALLYAYASWLKGVFSRVLENNKKIYLLSIALQLAISLAVYVFAEQLIENIYSLFACVILAISILYFVLNTKNNSSNWARILTAVTFVLLYTFQINSMLDKKENEYRKLYAYKILHERDLELEMRLADAEDKLEKNNVFESCIYEDSAFNREEFEEILKYNYLIDFLSDFDIFIESFSGETDSWTEGEKKSFDNYQKIYLATSEDGLSHSFLKVKESSGFSGYISAHISGEFDESDYQSVFILLRQKVRSSQRALSEFTGKSAGIPTSIYNYYHALYISGRLSRVSPEFPFERYNALFDSEYQESFLEKEGYSIFVYNPENERTLVLVKELRSLSNKFTVFAGLILAFFTIWFFLIFLKLLIRIVVLNIKGIAYNGWARFRFYIPSFKNMLLQNKIQTALFFELILSFVAGSVMVANFISVNYEGTQQRLLLEKLRGISAELEKSGIIDFKSKTGPKREFLIDLSESYNIDISLFNTNGVLWLSSSPDLYKNAVINEYINPVAFKQLSQKKLYSYNQNERLYAYKYSSFYQAVFNHNQELAGYIHLPFFAREQDANREMTSLFVSMLNIFVIFFIITGVLSAFLSKVITRPLASISLSLRKLRVGGKNEEINWQSNDEIGQLVKTYNAVLLQLEESAEKLASTEREGAWREMAKQVAHEIKNPLTPMRLSVQHLQRSVSEAEPDVQEKIKRVSELLINQIDIMSKMAEEFSSFAKMPIAIPEDFDISILLNEIVVLFQKTQDFEITLNGLENSAIIHVDKDQIKRVFTNIFKNAYQAKKEDQNCKLNISAKVNNNILEIAFSDNGVGIDDSLREKIFHPNFSTKTSGMGLGLAISKKIIELAGGSISFESTQGVGTTFYITLPLAEI